MNNIILSLRTLTCSEIKNIFIRYNNNMYNINITIKIWPEFNPEEIEKIQNNKKLFMNHILHMLINIILKFNELNPSTHIKL